MKRVKIGKDAALEFEEAAAWYEKEQRGLGARFISAFEHAIQILAEANSPLTPVGGKAGKEGAQKLILHKFPFSVIVIALAHHSRMPGYWKSRVAP